MKLKLSLSISFERSGKRADAAEEPPFFFESQGTLVETRPQPTYVGFEALEPLRWEDRRR